MKHIILAVDDDPEILELLKETFSGREFSVRAASSEREFRDLLEISGVLPDLILLDVKLPDGDGHEILAKLKSDEKNSSIPVFLMSGYRINPPQIAESIDNGAAQYITKPFAPEVLRAYAWNALKTNASAAATSDEICRCGVKLCPTERKVCRGNGDVHLSPIEFDLFFALLEKSPAVVSRDALLAKVWGEDATDTCEHSIEVYVSKLKKKLGAELGGKIKGVYKAGYKFLKSRRTARTARPSGRTKTLRLKR